MTCFSCHGYVRICMHVCMYINLHNVRGASKLVSSRIIDEREELTIVIFFRSLSTSGTPNIDLYESHNFNVMNRKKTPPPFP